MINQTKQKAISFMSVQEVRAELEERHVADIPTTNKDNALKKTLKRARLECELSGCGDKAHDLDHDEAGRVRIDWSHVCYV